MSAEQSLNWSDEDDAGTNEAPQDSTVIRELRKVNNSQAKRLRELEDKLSSYTKESRSRSVQSLLVSRDLNPKIAAFIPEDVEATEEALGKWLDEYGDVFGALPAAAPAPVSPSLGTLRQMDALGSQAQSSIVGNDLMAAIANVSSVQELDALIARSTGQQ